MKNNSPRVFIILLLSVLVGCCFSDSNGGNTDDLPNGPIPTITSTSPTGNDDDVPINQFISASFNMAMDPSSLTSDSFSLRSGSTSIPGTVTYSGVTAIFRPGSDLAMNTDYTVTITNDATNVAGVSLARNHTWTFNTGDTADNTAPTVTSNSPADGVNNAAISSQLSATFSEAMDPLSITGSSFTLMQGQNSIPGTVTYSAGVAHFSPQSNLQPGRLYTAMITSDATDLSGNHLLGNHLWTFTTSGTDPSLDTPPEVTFTAPANNEDDVALNISPLATFSQVMDADTITGTTFTLRQGTEVITGSVSYSGVSAVFNPSSPLEANTSYSVTVSDSVRNIAGIAMLSDYSWTFTTGTTLDNTAPTVISTVPFDGETDVEININPTATFSEEMNVLTVTSSTFRIRQGTATVSGSVFSIGSTVVFLPDTNLDPNAEYTATISGEVEDLAGNTMASDYVWTFTTGTNTDSTAPTVVSTVPVNAADNVDVAIVPLATFSEEMNPLTIVSSSFRLRHGTATVSGNVHSEGNLARFIPLEELLPDTLYTATISTGAEDLAGNPLASDYVWTFTTGPGIVDIIAPTVVSTFPEDEAIDVAVTTNPSATFSEEMDSATITGTSFTLMDGLIAVPGIVSYSGVTATFTPASDLDNDTVYTATITTDAEDSDGNPLEADYTWTFTTALLPDTEAPTVLSTIPEDEATNVDIASNIEATFSEEMNPTTITTSSFTLMNGLLPVLGNVSYSGTTATFVPQSNLETNTLYTATITTDAEDLAGNPLAVDYVWTFTTEVVNLGEIEHIGGFGGGAGMTNQGIFTVVDGDIATTAAATLVTGFHDSAGDIYTETPLNIGQVTGIVYAAPPPPGSAEKFVIASQAALDAQQAYIDISPASLPGGSDPGAGELGGLTLFPGVYMSAGGSFQITGSDLTLDAQGDPDAVWVFQAPSTLTVGDTAPRSVILINGAQAKNVYWYVGSAATINGAGGGTMVGTIIASAGVTFSTAGNVTLTFLEGRAIGLAASVTLVNTIINIPE